MTTDKITGICRICGKACNENDEFVKTKRKQINWFHLSCITKEIEENNAKRNNNNME